MVLFTYICASMTRDAGGFYSKLVAVGETVALVPTIEAREAQATVESDRVRIFKVRGFCV